MFILSKNNSLYEFIEIHGIISVEINNKTSEVLRMNYRIIKDVVKKLSLYDLVLLKQKISILKYKVCTEKVGENK
ncbi:hypothetical protein [Viridibacillus arvi]|uniref:hypothetical protein n=1 Tax=Viridibacillus arvi TaxID=263475 RepID=UPI0034CD4184